MKYIIMALLLSASTLSYSKVCNITNSNVPNIKKLCKASDILVLSTSKAKIVGAYCDHKHTIAIIPTVNHKYDRQAKTAYKEISNFSSTCIFRKN